MTGPGKVRPETLEQARTWTRYRNHYAEVIGLCDTCAAQAAYGHQHGWNAVDKPCLTCLPLVGSLPRSAGNGWRYAEPHAGRREVAVHMAT